MKRWQLVLGCCTTVIAILLCAWVVVHQRNTIRGYARLHAADQRSSVNREKLSAILSQLGLDHIIVERPEEVPIVVLRQDGQTDVEFIADVDSARAGVLRLLSLNCVTLQCGTETVQLCVACGINETPEHCQQRLNDLHATYCALHPNCTPCP